MKNWFWKNAQGAASEASTLADLIDAAKRGEIVASTQVSNDGETWKSAADVPALADALGLAVEAETPKNPPRNKKSGTNWLLIAFLIGNLILVLLKTLGR